MRTRVYQNVARIELPASARREIRPHSGRNTRGQIADDAADPSAAANRDYSDRRALLLADGAPLDKLEDAIGQLIIMERQQGIG